MIVCMCSAVPESVVVDAARSGLSVEAIASATGAGTDCGCCTKAIEGIVRGARRCGRTGGPCTGSGRNDPAADACPDRDAA